MPNKKTSKVVSKTLRNLSKTKKKSKVSKKSNKNSKKLLKLEPFIDYEKRVLYGGIYSSEILGLFLFNECEMVGVINICFNVCKIIAIFA